MFKTIIRAAAICGALITLSACATGAVPTAMVVSPNDAIVVAPGAPGYHQLKVASVGGGSETNPLWMSDVSNDAFKTALEASLQGVAYLSDDPTKANLQVTAAMVDLKRPMAGLDMSVTSTVRYTVAPVAGGAPVFDETIAATGTARFGEALAAVERLRKANEASIKANITLFIQHLEASLKSDGPH
ncbi:MAG: hypothetical protein P4L64_13255 [Caulobacteraceae bacterium]|nr:hypothetical protein [Caulobacteraceae bacterium]